MATYNCLGKELKGDVWLDQEKSKGINLWQNQLKVPTLLSHYIPIMHCYVKFSHTKKDRALV